MTVDFIDQAFLRRLEEPVMPTGHAVAIAGIDVVRWLVTNCPEQWAKLADRLESGFAAGDRVVAVAGRARGDGCSTIVRGLVHVLRARGIDVTCHAGDPAHPAGGRRGVERGGPVLVDAGVWFPPGPLHRARLARAVIGCHAALLVRRAARRPCPVHERALEALGVHVLGEVVTFGDPRDSEAASA